PNNSGKSAIVEALRCLATNPPPKHVIRHGAAQARVQVELETGVRVAWVRKKNTAWYELYRPGQEEPEYFRKLGRGMVPDEVREALRLDGVDLEGGRTVDVHVGNQRTPIFLLNEDGADARLAEFFAASSESAHLLAMQKALQARNRKAKTRETDLTGQMRSLEQGLERLEALPELTRQGERARALGREIEALERVVPALERGLIEQQRLERGLEKSCERAQALHVLSPPQTPYDTASLARQMQTLGELAARIRRSRRRAQAIAPLTATPELFSTTMLAGLIRDCNSLEIKMKSSILRFNALRELQPTSELFNELPLAGLLSDMQALDKRRANAQDVALARAARVREMEAEILRKLKEVGSCPLCGGKLDADAFTGKGERT
ncbi:MAG: signaling protein, partial [Desulfovibrionaceae bacterium]